MCCVSHCINAMFLMWCLPPVCTSFMRRGSYRMEDWLHFVEAFESFVFLRGDVLSPVLQTMWDHLVAAVRHYFCPSGDEAAQSSQEARAAARGHLLEYGQLLELHNFPHRVFTVNLHICVCR